MCCRQSPPSIRLPLDSPIRAYALALEVGEEIVQGVATLLRRLFACGVELLIQQVNVLGRGLMRSSALAVNNAPGEVGSLGVGLI